jgi:hypothetical protein
MYENDMILDPTVELDENIDNVRKYNLFKYLLSEFILLYENKNNNKMKENFEVMVRYIINNEDLHDIAKSLNITYQGVKNKIDSFIKRFRNYYFNNYSNLELV